MSSHGSEFEALFLQEASEHLQTLREYANALFDAHPSSEHVERLYVAAHTLKGSSAMYGYPLFSAIAAKLDHAFQYVANIGIKPEAAAPLVEFVSEAVAVLEADLLMVSDQGAENAEEIAAFRQKYSFAFRESETPEPVELPAMGSSPDSVSELSEKVPDLPPFVPAPIAPEVEETVVLPPDTKVGPEILEFFVPEAEEHFQTATACLLALESNPNREDVNRLFRAMHTLKGAAAQVGLSRIAWVAHRAEDLVCRLRDEQVQPSAEIVDLCLDAIDVLKKFVYRQWPDEDTVQSSVQTLLGRMAHLAPGDDKGRAQEESKKEEAQPQISESTAPATPGAEVPAQTEAPLQEGEFYWPPRPPEKIPAGGPTETSSAAALAGMSLDESVPRAPAFPESAFTETAEGSADVDMLGTAGLPPRQPETRVGDPLSPPEVEQAGSSPEEPAANAAEVPSALSADHGFLGQGAAAVQRPSDSVVSPPPASPVAEGARPAPQSGVSSPAYRAHSGAESTPAAKSAFGTPARSVRIPLDHLDRMMNAVGELVVTRTRMLGRLAELEQLADTLNFSKGRMADKVVEFQDKYEYGRLQSLPLSSSMSPAPGENKTGRPGLRPQAALPFPYRGGYSSYSHSFDTSLAEFSELEMDRYDDFNILSRSLTEISADIGEIVSQLDAFVRRVDGDIDEFKKLSHRLQDEITRARRLPIVGLFTRLSRTVREAAKSAGKQVTLELVGAETELDGNILQQIADPLLHLVRNAVAHGIEGEEERYARGKPDHGKIAVRAHHHDGHIHVEVEDDGGGIDWERVRATAVRLGLAGPAEAANLTQAQLQELLFQPGFSTTAHGSELAGRGVGLDVVRTNVNGLKGAIEIETQKGMGTRFTLKIPLTLIISQALFVRVRQQMFALPLACVQEVRRIHETEIESVEGKLVAKVRDTVTELVRIDQQLGLEPFRPAHGYHVLVLVKAAGRAAGILVEEVLRKDEIVVKELGEYLHNVKLFPGATVAPDGSLILLLDVERLCAGEAIERRPLMTSPNAATADIFMPAPEGSEAPPEPIPEVKVVLLADDSISVRKFVGRMLEKAGYQVQLAADGLEALEILGHTRCDLVITDLEMPRTNGYELMAHLRQDPATRGVPVMVVTSRAGAKHRERALQQGAAEFLVKPVQEEEFIAAVSKLLAGTKAAPDPLEARA